MPVEFNSPSFRASSSDLTVAISPLGLVELADEEFEVHGPRINRYANGWAWYLGHHWAYRRPAGESQVTFNYAKAFSDYLTNFTFSKGIGFSTPKETEAIIPHVLKRVWNQDNDQKRILWEIGNMGSVSGDSFVKVAYEEPWVDSIGRTHAGRLRIIPLNSSFCFPEFHPHDRTRLIRFKLKYRFWGTSLEGTRQVFTYTELLTEDTVEEYVNDELIDSRPNQLGQIPIVHIPNTIVSSGPWGLSDIQDITELNREYNEKATEISDIINYHAEPVTIVSGAKASQLEKGTNKIWGGLPDKAKVYNLDNGVNLSGPLAYLDMVKRGMHELTGVPENALGQTQPMSNTSQAAQQNTYQSLMIRYHQKQITYGAGIRRINELAILIIALKEPWMLQYDYFRAEGVALKQGQYAALDPADPRTYENEVEWPSPMPLDIQSLILEVQGLMSLGLESKRGALRRLGEDMPDQKIAEIFEEQIEDTKEDAARQILQAEGMLAAQILTGALMPEQPESSNSSGEGEGAPAPAPSIPPHVLEFIEEVSAMAHQGRLPMAAPTSDTNSNA